MYLLSTGFDILIYMAASMKIRKLVVNLKIFEIFEDEKCQTSRELI